jgi:hypothetical protein
MVTPTGIVPGSRIGGKYEVVEVLGYGGMGVVYKVREQVGAVSRIRALKTVLPRHATNASIVARFREEAEKMCLLEHDNIVPVLSYSEEGEFPYLVMPFIEGQTLKEFLAAHMAKFGRPLPLVDVADIGLQITRGLEVAHHFSNPETGKLQPIIHRDIKPGNIMVRLEGRSGERTLRVLIMDFGIAKLVSDEDTGHTLTDVIGTVKYASPEQVQRSKDIDTRADIYSLGMVLYELYCGHHVFADTSEHGVLMRMMQKELEEIVPKFPDGTPAEFRELISKSIAVSRDARWNDVTEVRVLLKQIHDTEKARRSDDSRQAEELAMTSRTAAIGTGASEFAASAFGQAERIAEQAKAAREKSLHTDATQLFQQAATAFEQAKDYAAQARERELLVARIGAVRALRDAAAAAGAEALAAQAFAEAVQATEAAERALASNDLKSVEREAHRAELAWANAKQTAERAAARREAEAAHQELDRAVNEESEKLAALPTGIRSVEAVKRLAEARAQLGAALVASRSQDPRQAAPALAAARAALDAATGARAAHLERSADEQAEKLTARVRELEAAQRIPKLAPSLAALEELLAAAEQDRSEGRVAEALERLERAKTGAEALAVELDRARSAEERLSQARAAAEQARSAAEDFAESPGGKEEFRLGSDAWKRAERVTASDAEAAAREYAAATQHFERALAREKKRQSSQVAELRRAAVAAADELRGLGDRFTGGKDARALFDALEKATTDADAGKLADAIRELEPLPDRFRELTTSAKQALEAESAQQQAEEAQGKAEQAAERVRALGARVENDERARRGREELKRGTEQFRSEEWAPAAKAFDTASERLNSLADAIAAEDRAEQLRTIGAKLRRVTDELKALTPTTRRLRRQHRDAEKIAESAAAAIASGEERKATSSIETLEIAIEQLRADLAKAATEPASRAPVYLGGAAAVAAAAAGLYFAAPKLFSGPEVRPTPFDVAEVTAVPTPAPRPTAIPTVAPRPTVAPTLEPRPTSPPPTAAPVVIVPTAAPIAPTEIPVIVAKPTIAPTALPVLALASAEPESRALRIRLGGEQRFTANVTGGDESDLVWRVNEREAGRGGSFVLGRSESAAPGPRRVALVTRLGGRTETLASWQVEVQAPELAFAGSTPGTSRFERDVGAQVDFEAPVRPADVDGLRYEWTVNGERASGASGSRYRLRTNSPGSYTVTVKASAPWGASIDKSWSLTVNKPKPTPAPVVASRPGGAESELRDWISTYCGAFERKDTGKLLALGHLKTAAEAERLGEALSVMQNLKLSCTNPSIRVDGNSATVSFDRTDRWTDPRGNPVERTLPRITKALRREGSGWIVVR